MGPTLSFWNWSSEKQLKMDFSIENPNGPMEISVCFIRVIQCKSWEMQSSPLVPETDNLILESRFHNYVFLDNTIYGFMAETVTDSRMFSDKQAYI